MLSDVQIETSETDILVHIDTVRAEKILRQNCRLSGIPAAECHTFTFEIQNRSDVRVRSRNENCREFHVGIAHREHFTASARSTMDADVREVGIPGNVNDFIEKRFNLSFVIREQHVVARNSARSEKIIDHFPDRHDLRIISDRAYSNTLGFGHTRRLYSCWDSCAKHSPPRRGGD